MNPKPTVGRIVHYHNRNIIEAALIVSVLNDETVNLVVWNAGGSNRVETSIQFGPKDEHHRWSWPERV